MTITTISDTHGLHRRIRNIPLTDIIIQAGDVLKAQVQTIRSKPFIIKIVYLLYEKR